MLETPELSVVIATFNRASLLTRLLLQLDAQTLEPSRFEVRVVDDGSTVPFDASSVSVRYALSVERQDNRGAAAARNRGAVLARGDVLVFIDDDMQVAPEFLARHLAHHRENERLVVLGRIARDPSVKLPLFERWHAAMLERLANEATSGKLQLRGNHFFTGNASVRRADFFAAGGFDEALGHSEDAELGLRLEKAGCRFLFDGDARVLHGSDHTREDKWLRRAFLYGQFDHRIGRKHPELNHANPWRFLGELSPALRPALALSVIAPRSTERLARAALKTADVVGRFGFERLALMGTTAAFGIQYFRGMREEQKTLGAALRDYSSYHLARAQTAVAFRECLAAIRADQAAMRIYEQKYGHHTPSKGSLASDLVQKIGLQQLAAYRVARMFRSMEKPTLAKLVTRISRQLFGSDLHWDADFAPGVMLVHGFGLAVSHAAKVGRHCIVFHNVTLGMGTDPLTRAIGAPTIEENVHLGPGATLLGPITVGRNSKVMAGAVVTRSIPPDSVVEAGAADIRVRPRGELATVAAAGALSESGADR